MHAELQRTQQLAASPASKSEFRLIDPKTMAPEKFGQSPEPSWLDWSENTRAYIEILDADLANDLNHVEDRQAPMLHGGIDAFLLNDSHCAQLRRYFKLSTKGNS